MLKYPKEKRAKKRLAPTRIVILTLCVLLISLQALPLVNAEDDVEPVQPDAAQDIVPVDTTEDNAQPNPVQSSAPVDTIQNRIQPDATQDIAPTEAKLEYGVSYDGESYTSYSFADEGWGFSQETITPEYTEDYLYIKIFNAVTKKYPSEFIEVDVQNVKCSFQNKQGAFGVENNGGVFKIPVCLLNQEMGDWDKMALELPGGDLVGYSIGKIVITSSGGSSPDIKGVDLKGKEYIEPSGNVLSIDNDGKPVFAGAEASDNPYTVEYTVDADGNYDVSEVTLNTYSCNMYFTYDEAADALTFDYTNNGQPPEYIQAGTTFVRYADRAFIGDKGYKTLQAAYEAAQDGDVINLDAGTFTEDLNIEKNITITGKGAGSTTIKGKLTFAGCTGVVNNLKIENNTATAYGTALITLPKNGGKASVTFNNCVVNDNDTAFRVESAGSNLTLNNTDVTAASHYGIGVRNSNQTITVNGGTIKGWAGIMTSGGGVENGIKDSKTKILVKGATIIGDLGEQKGSYGAIVLQENFHGVTLTIENSKIIAEGNLISALDIRAYGSTVTVKDSTLTADDLVYGAIDGETKEPNYSGAIAVTENQDFESIYKDAAVKPGTVIKLTGTTIGCEQIKKTEDGYEGTYPVTCSRSGDTITIDGKNISDMTKLTLSDSGLKINIGQTRQLKANYNPAYFYDSVKWTSGNSEIATVDSDGRITAVKTGKTTITAAIEEQKVTCEVIVYKTEKPVIPPPTGGGSGNATIDINAGADKVMEDSLNDVIQSIETSTAITETTRAALKEAIAAGKSISVQPEVNTITKNDITKKELSKIESKLGANGKIAQYFTLDMNITADGKEIGTINQLTGKAEFTITINENLIKSGRTFYMIRLHEDGTAEKLTGTLDNGQFTFATDKFSIYALAYEDKLSGEDASKGVPTGDHNEAGGYVALCTLALAAAYILTKKRRDEAK